MKIALARPNFWQGLNSEQMFARALLCSGQKGKLTADSARSAQNTPLHTGDRSAFVIRATPLPTCLPDTSITLSHFGRLLLGQAMQGAESPDQIDGVDAYDRTVLDQLRQDAQCEAIFWVVERRHQNRRVANIEVRIAGRQPAAVEIERRRHGKGHKLGPRAILQPEVLRALAVFL